MRETGKGTVTLVRFSSVVAFSPGPSTCQVKVSFSSMPARPSTPTRATASISLPSANSPRSPAAVLITRGAGRALTGGGQVRAPLKRYSSVCERGGEGWGRASMSSRSPATRVSPATL